MSTIKNRYFPLALLPLAMMLPRANAATACEALKGLKLMGTAITAAESHPGGAEPFAVQGPPGMVVPPTVIELPAHCRVTGTLSPTKDSAISFELWMPLQHWNHRYQQLGNGGLAGSIPRASMAEPLQLGWAVAATDDGHVGGSMSDGQWALGHPEKVVDYGYRAVHVLAQRAREIVRAFYRANAAHAYFIGCSDGGRESLMEAQRFPQDFDGFLAGAPAMDLAGFAVRAIQGVHTASAPGSAALSPIQAQLVADKALEQCDAADGVPDGVLRDPLSCHFKVQQLLCRGAASDSCLTQAQVDAVQAYYDDIRDPKSGKVVAYGYDTTLGTAVPPLGADSPLAGISQQILANMVYGKPDQKLQSLEALAAYDELRSKIGTIVDPLNPDLSTVRRAGKKIIQYHGWADPLISAKYSMAYFSAAQAANGDTGNFYRLFLAPGMGHCGGGVGPSWITGQGVAHDADHDAVVALTRWVEQGVAPDEIIATEFAGPALDPLNGPPAGTAVKSTRPLCPYPQVAVYNGSGDHRDAASFRCQRP